MKGYLAEFIILALLFSAFIHAVLDCVQDSSMHDCACEREGASGFELVDEAGGMNDTVPREAVSG